MSVAVVSVAVVSVAVVSVVGSVVLHAEIATAITRASKMRHVIFILFLQEIIDKKL